MNPYEILGISRNATPEEIKKAYRALVKKYHPDQFGDNPLRELATEKLSEINKAYDMLMKNPNGFNPNESYASSSSDDTIFQEVRFLIQNRNFREALSRLNSISNRNAEWNFLMGICHLNSGWYETGVSHLKTAVDMDPTNPEYRGMLQNLQQRNQNYNEQYRNTMGGNVDMCNCCLNFICINTLCNCLCGDPC